LLAGLDYDYTSFIENVSTKSDPISVSDVYAQFLAVKSRIDLQSAQQQATSVNTRCMAAKLEDTVEVTVLIVVVHLQEEVEGVLAAAMVDMVNKGRPRTRSVSYVTRKAT
jgi:hypothetical protein